MKFWQRQLLVILSVACGGIVLLLHSRIPGFQNPDLALARGGGRLVQNLAFNPPDVSHLKANQPDAGHLKPSQVDGIHLSADLPHAIYIRANQTNATHLGANQTSKLWSWERGEGGADHKSWRTPAPPVSYVQRAADGECPKILRPVKVVENQTFQPVDSEPGLFVFSAFLDVSENLVRIIGLKSLVKKSAFCLLWYSDGHKDLRVVAANVSPLPESHSRKYSAAYIQCPLPDQRQPYAVSVTLSDCRQKGADVGRPSNVLLVQKEGELQRNFTVCVTALNYRYSRAYELVEMVELNRILGAGLITFYVHSVGDNVAQVLRWYQKKGLVQLVSWDLPVNVDHWPPDRAKPPEVHYFAQLASHNDCLNRHRGSSRYLVYQDLDEFIIPKKHRTWMELLDSLKNTRNTAYLFRCMFFRKDWPGNEENFPGRAIADKFKSVVLSTDKREPNAQSRNQRAKYIVNPRKIQTVGIHNIWRYRGRDEVTYVEEKDGLLHHYRDWENPGDKQRSVRDTDIYRYREELLSRLSERWAELPAVPLDIPLASYGQV